MLKLCVNERTRLKSKSKKKNKLGVSQPHKGPIAEGARVIVGA